MPESVELKINNKAFRNWSEIEITLGLDTFSTATFSAPFEAERFEFRETFRPFRYQSVSVDVGVETMFDGFMLAPNPTVKNDARTVDVLCYATPAAFADITVPAAALPIEFRGQTLRQIAAQLADLFDVRLYVPGGTPEGAAFDKAAIEKDQKIGAFLADLAKHRSIVVSNTFDGSLLLWQSIATGQPVARLRDDEQPVIEADTNFDPQNYHSSLTGFAPAKSGSEGSQFTVQNPFLTDVDRPLSFVLNDIEKGDVPEATRAKLGRMLANMVAYTVKVATWRDPAGDLWRPNTTVTLTAPNLMVYQETELLVRTVALKQTPEGEEATLGLVVPGSFSAETPDRLPWDE